MNAQLFSNVRGNGEVLILLHGLFGCSDNLSRVAKELSEDFEVHSLDLRNHGKSFHSDEMNYGLMAFDIVSYMDGNNIQSSILLGHSMGGKVAMTMALMHPERVIKLIVADIAPVHYEAHHQEIITGLCSVNFDIVNTRREVDRILSKTIRNVGVRQFLLKNLLISDNKKISWKMNLKGITENYKNIQVGMAVGSTFAKPVLFIAGGLSDYIKAEYRKETMSFFPKAEMKVISGASHWLHAEKPRIFINICLRFLQ